MAEVLTLETKANKAKSLIEQSLIDVVEDVGAVYEDAVIEALQELKPAAYMRYRQQAKKANKGVTLATLDALVKGQGVAQDEQGIAEQVVDFVKSKAELLCDAGGNAYARIHNHEHAEIWPLDSKGFREWLAADFYREMGLMVKESPMKDACLTLSGAAKYGEDGQSGNVVEVCLRTAKTDVGYAIDLCNERWQSVMLERGKWWIDNEQQVAFRRTQTMQALPTPLAPGSGDIEALWDVVNCRKSDRNMLLAFIVECLRPDTAYAVAEISAEQGSGKSKAQSFIRCLIDPNAVNLKARPKTTEDIFVGAINSGVVSYENLSHLSDDMQDAFCILATGGGYASRKLFTNDEESAISVKRPIIMNGISHLATRQDLVDRTINIDLDPITPAQRKTESEIDALFAEKWPLIFTGLLDLFAETLTVLGGIHLDKLPRMADFALLGAAVYQVRGIKDPEAAFMRDYNAMREDAIYRTLDSSPIASAVFDYLKDHPTGYTFNTVKLALHALEKYKGDAEAWPKSPRGLGDIIRRLEPAFRQIDICVSVSKQRATLGYPVTIKPINQKPAYVL